MVSPALRAFRHYRFQVPWCVPAWGWSEFRTTAGCVLCGRIVRGRAVEDAAARLKDAVGRRFAIPVGHGRHAIWLALQALGVGPEDEVVLPAYVCATVLEAVIAAGARPVFADVEPDLQVSPAIVAPVLTSRTRCVIVPHLLGKCAPVDRIQELLRPRGIALIDDAAQGFGARIAGRPAGSFGEFGIVCGGPGKPLAACGGAALLMDDPDLYERASRVRLAAPGALAVLGETLGFWFWRRLRRHTLPFAMVLERFRRRADPPFSPRAMSNLEAGLLLAQLTRVQENDVIRRRNAAELLRILAPAGWQALTSPAGDELVLKLVFVLPGAAPPLAAVIRGFADAGIECQGGYRPCHPPGGALPVTEAIWPRVLCIPVEVRLKDAAPLAALARHLEGGSPVGIDPAHAHSR